jgi:predicted phage-related endonuclease
MQDVRTDRNKYIGGSDIPIIMNISPFKKRFDLLLEKADLLENEFEGNVYTEYGNILEPKIREYINKLKNTNYIEYKKIEGNIRCHLDGFNEVSVLEIKTTSQIRKKVSSYKKYLVQLLFYMQTMKVDKGLLVVYERPKDFCEEFHKERLQLHEIDIKDYEKLLLEINESVEDFKKDLEKIKENPFLEEWELEEMEQ